MRFTIDDGQQTYEITASDWGDAVALVYDWAALNLCGTSRTYTVTLEDGPQSRKPYITYTYYGVPR